MTDGLFDMDPTPVVVKAPLSPGQRRTQRQAEAVAKGSHPLARVFPMIRRHPDTRGGSVFAATDPRGRELTCGSCVFREVADHHGRSYAKCWVDNGVRVSNGPATDVRSWWPACADWASKVQPEGETAEQINHDRGK